MYNAIRGANEPFGRGTIADGIAVRLAGTHTTEIIRQRVDDLVLVDESELERAVLLLLEVEKTVVEGAGAAGLAALLLYRERFAGQRVGLVLCGGNIDPLVLAGIIERGMVRSGRLARIRIEMRDIPGALAQVTQILADCNANIEEVHHQRAFTALAIQNAEVELVLRTRDVRHIEEIVAALTAAGFPAVSDPD
jgi:threonine dehydratase